MKKDELINNLKENILVISSDVNDVRELSKFISSSRLHSIPDLDTLLIKMDQITGDITLCFMVDLPEDILISLGQIVEFVDSSSNMDSIIEFGSRHNFKKSVLLGGIREFESLFKDGNVNAIETVTNEVVSVANVDVVSNVGIATESSYDQLEALKIEARGRIKELDSELSQYKRLYAEKLEEVDALGAQIYDLKIEIDMKNELIEGDLSNREKELNDQVSELSERLRESSDDLVRLNAFVSTLQDDLNDSRSAFTSLRLESDAQRELLLDKKKVIDDLKDKLDTEERIKRELMSDLSRVKTDYLSPMEFEKLEETIEKRDDEIDSLQNQLRELRIIAKKSDTEKSMIESDLEGLKSNYKELLNNSSVLNRDLDEVILDDLESRILYFKVINQPLYFRSFLEETHAILKEGRKVLVVLLRDEDELSSVYYRGIRKISSLDEVSEHDEVVWVKPSKLMFPKDPSFYKKYDFVIIVDYLNTKKRYIRGENVKTIHTFLDQREADMLDIKGMILSAGDRSIVDMKYDDRYVMAPTKLARRFMVKRKVKDWLNAESLI